MELDIFFQLILATLLGALIGLEREIKKKEAGLKTYSLVALGTCFLVIITFIAFEKLSGKLGVILDPSRIIQGIVTGIGFLGGGIIIYRQFHIEGLTTAAGLWVVTAIAIAVGLKLYFLAILVTFLTILILSLFSIFEQKILRRKVDQSSQERKK